MSTAARVQLHRARAKEGRRVLRAALAIDPDAIAALVGSGVIPAHETDAELAEYLAGLVHVIAEPRVARAVRELMAVIASEA
jgi:hypothetical protein